MSIIREAAAFIAIVLLLCVTASALRAQSSTTTTPHAFKSVTLTPDSCAQVSNGDNIVFEWNPAFDPQGGVVGMQSFLLVFAKPGQEEQAMQGTSGIRLVADHKTKLAGSHNATFTPLPNGYFQLHFRPHLLSVEPGQYNLIGARAFPAIDPQYRGSLPVMTNSPLRYPFCLEVMAASGTQ